MEKLEVRYGSFLKLINYGGLGCFGLMALGGVSTLFPLRDETILMGVFVLGSGWAAWVMGRRALSGRPALIVDDDGLTLFMLGTPVPLPWEELARANLQGTGEGEGCINLWVRDRDRFRARMPLTWRILRGLRDRIAPRTRSRDAFLYLPYLTVEPQALIDAIKEKAPSAWEEKAGGAAAADAHAPTAADEDVSPADAPAVSEQVSSEPPQPETPSGSAADQDVLKKLAELHDRGILSDEEYAAKKKQLLGE